MTFLPWMMLYQSLYGHFLGPSTIRMNMSGQFWHFGRGETLMGVLICPARGLFVYQPWAILALVGVWHALRPKSEDRALRGFAIFCLGVIAAHVTLIAAWHDWSGGYCWGSRLLTEIIPLLGLLAVTPIEFLLRSRGGLAILLILGVAGAMTHLPGVYLGAPKWNYVTDHDRDLWSWTNAPFFYR